MPADTRRSGHVSSATTTASTVRANVERRAKPDAYGADPRGDIGTQWTSQPGKDPHSKVVRVLELAREPTAADAAGATSEKQSRYSPRWAS